MTHVYKSSAKRPARIRRSERVIMGLLTVWPDFLYDGCQSVIPRYRPLLIFVLQNMNLV